MHSILPSNPPAPVLAASVAGELVVAVRPRSPHLDVNSAATRIRRELGLRIQDWRIGKRWTLDALASAIGVSPSTISLWEHAKRTPSLENLVALAMVMDVSPGCLLGPGKDGSCPPGGQRQRPPA